MEILVGSTEQLVLITLHCGSNYQVSTYQVYIFGNYLHFLVQSVLYVDTTSYVVAYAQFTRQIRLYFGQFGICFVQKLMLFFKWKMHSDNIIYVHFIAGFSAMLWSVVIWPKMLVLHGLFLYTRCIFQKNLWQNICKY